MVVGTTTLDSGTVVGDGGGGTLQEEVTFCHDDGDVTWVGGRGSEETINWKYEGNHFNKHGIGK